MLEAISRRYSQYTDLARPLLLASNLLLLTLLMVNLAQLTWQLLPETTLSPRQTLPQQQTSSLTGSPNKTQPEQNWNIARWHLFGNAARRPKATLPITQPLPETRLNLTLRGIVSSATAGQGGAIIATANGQQSYYTTGATVPGGAVLQSIHKDHVVLKRSGRLEKLKLPRQELGLPAKETTNNTFRQGNTTHQGSLAGLRQQILRNPQQLLNVFSVEPYTNRGQFIGYRLRPGRDRSLFKRTGLQNGDIVTRINGIRLDTPAKAMTALRGLAQSPAANLQIRRNGQLQTLRIDLSN